ncbi:hypothetical protein HMPREF9555_00770 [Selenomonas artemidis F0399]|uniref:Uncharacterized protein n=1 Tax=Selenomonas artemidis F0399 TaxID=749551 RepID=E7N1B7_9FIRM|nr:hypothetical protein HMPREF9555_00770 [Selenomonas artemidis F0399]
MHLIIMRKSHFCFRRIFSPILYAKMQKVNHFFALQKRRPASRR